jgi:ubiquinone/menaquinone biosynthesis C-methylase UbiE
MTPSFSPSRDFTPAVPVLAAYDPIIALLTREKRWRTAIVRQVGPAPGEVIVDAGCGTGSLLALLGRDEPKARLVGLDPDARILDIARIKLGQGPVRADLRQGYLREVAALCGDVAVDKIVSTLVFHQVPMAEKRAGLAAIHAALVTGGQVHIADYGLQRTVAMRTLFRMVQAVDGVADTQPNADGILPSLMTATGFVDVEETQVIPTVTGSISFYRGRKP